MKQFMSKAIDRKPRTKARAVRVASPTVGSGCRMDLVETTRLRAPHPATRGPGGPGGLTPANALESSAFCRSDGHQPRGHRHLRTADARGLLRQNPRHRRLDRKSVV